jgi:hypothetical protein
MSTLQTLKTEDEDATLEIFAVTIHFAVFWVMAACRDVVGYHRFGGLCCLHLQVVTPYSDVVGYQRFGGYTTFSFRVK